MIIIITLLLLINNTNNNDIIQVKCKYAQSKPIYQACSAGKNTRLVHKQCRHGRGGNTFDYLTDKKIKITCKYCKHL